MEKFYIFLNVHSKMGKRKLGKKKENFQMYVYETQLWDKVTGMHKSVHGYKYFVHIFIMQCLYHLCIFIGKGIGTF